MNSQAFLEPLHEGVEVFLGPLFHFLGFTLLYGPSPRHLNPLWDQL